MKLVRCDDCGDIFNLTDKVKYCTCQQAWGVYVDDINAEVGGHCLVLGIANYSFHTAVKNHEQSPDGVSLRPEERWEKRGWTFDAFIIPETAKTVRRIDD